ETGIVRPDVHAVGIETLGRAPIIIYKEERVTCARQFAQRLGLCGNDTAFRPVLNDAHPAFEDRAREPERIAFRIHDGIDAAQPFYSDSSNSSAMRMRSDSSEYLISIVPPCWARRKATRVPSRRRRRSSNSRSSAE